jgi:phosphate transport system protein
MRKTFESEIQKLKNELLVLGSMVEQQIVGSVDALKKRDIDASRRIYEIDLQVNAKRYAIEEQVMVAIATQQPMAHDLRLLASILEVSGELERMGEQPLLKPLIDTPRMAQIGADMLHRALAAFVNEDVKVAGSIPYEDDEVDALYNQIYHELMMFVIQDAKTIERANWLLWVAHNLERVADRVTNICERTIFVATGEMKEIDASDDEIKTKKK